MDEPGRRLPTGTITFLFSDIEDSTRLVHKLDPRSYRELLEQHHRLLRAAFTAHGGVERGTQGDSFLVIFRDAASAVAAAVAAQRSLAAATWPAGAEVRVRMGLHSGEGIAGGDDYVGLDINRAARIASAAHGGQVLVSDSTRALAERALPSGVAVRDAGEHRLKGLDLPERLFQLTIEGLRADFPPLRTLAAGAAHVPLRLTSFVGRATELEELRRLLAANRLVTLVGPGGTGKTSLATEVARQVASDFADGSWFVDLAPLADAALVGPTVARSLGLSDQAERPIVDLLRTHLERREVLLVLDNFEHLLPASTFVADLLGVAPRLKVLVTSRSILGLYGEQAFAVAPLDLPSAGAVPDPDGLSRYEAVRLFVERAAAASPSFSVTRDNVRAIADICIRVDGLPLAIELAASRVRILEPREILARLEERLTLLTSAASNLPVRQRTLRGAIEWSYELLQPAERQLFARLAVFAGGCNLEAAEAVCNPGRELGLDTLEGIASLADQSLVRRTGGGESRFGMLETIREYGRERLEAAGGPAEIRLRHLRYYRDLAELAEPHFVGSEQGGWLDRFEREHDNLRAALTHAAELDDAESGLRLAAAVWRFWLLRGYLREGRSWLERLLALDAGAGPAVRAKAQIALGGLTYWLSDVEGTQAAYEAAARLYREAEDRGGEVDALYNLAFVPVMRGDLAEARRRAEAALAPARDLERADLVARIQIALARIITEAGDPEAAIPVFEAALTFFRSARAHFDAAGALGGIGRAHQVLGRHTAGRTAYLEALRLYSEAKDLPSSAATLEEISVLESSAGHHAEAVRLLGAGAALREATGASAPIIFRLLGGVQDEARRAIGDEAVEEALAEGRRMTLHEAVEYAATLAR